MRASGTSSCIRLSARRKVDLPQPLGPMMAVTARAAMSSETFLSTWLFAEEDGEIAHGQGRRRPARRGFAAAAAGVGWRSGCEAWSLS